MEGSPSPAAKRPLQGFPRDAGSAPADPASGAKNSPRGRTALLTAVGVLVALGIVAVASRGSTPPGSGDARGPGDTLLDILLSLYVVALVAGALFILYLLALRRAALKAAGGKQRRDMLTWVGLIVLVGAVLFLARDFAGRDLNIGETPAAPGEGIVGTNPDRQESERDFAWIPVLITLGLIAVAVAGVWWSERTRRRTRGDLRGSLLADAVAAAVDESLEDIRAEADPRRAVIAAYARLEQVLASHGLPRRPADAPLEYLRRMLAELSVSEAAARRLTDLFERAKFSQHAVGPEMKDEAIGALETVRDDLRAARALADQEEAAALARLRERAARQ